MNNKGPIFYVLDHQGNPVPEPDHLRWEEWFESSQNRVLKYDTIFGAVKVATAFACVDENFSREPPLLWLTMISGGPHDGYRERYASREDALAGYVRALEIAKGKSAHSHQ